MPAEPDRSRLLDVNRTTLRLWEWGEPSAPPVVCVHGAFDHGRMWDDFAPRLAARGHRVVAVDVRGHGDSGRLGSGHAWSAVGLDLAYVIDDLGGRAGLVGHSMGGGQALFVAAIWPELVPWIVNLDGLGPPPEGFDDVDLVESCSRAVTAIRRIATEPPRVYADREEMVERRAGMNPRLPEVWVRHLVEHGTRQVEGGWVWKSDPVFSTGFPGSFGLDELRTQFELVEAPVLVLTGSEPDTWSDLRGDVLRDRLSWLSSARHEVVDGAGHYVHVERPDATSALVDAFLDEVDR